MVWIRSLFKGVIYCQLFIFIGLSKLTPVFTVLAELGYLSWYKCCGLSHQWSLFSQLAQKKNSFKIFPALPPFGDRQIVYRNTPQLCMAELCFIYGRCIGDILLCNKSVNLSVPPPPPSSSGILKCGFWLPPAFLSIVCVLPSYLFAFILSNPACAVLGG